MKVIQSYVCQAPLSMGFSRREYWSGLPFPSPGDLPDPGIKPKSPALKADSLPAEPLQGSPEPVSIQQKSDNLGCLTRGEVSSCRMEDGREFCNSYPSASSVLSILRMHLTKTGNQIT